MMKVSQMVEKPSYHYAEDYLGVRNSRNEKKYYATFGQYVLTPEVFEELERQITVEGRPSEGKEFGLTAALDSMREKYGMCAFLPDGESFDIGLPDSYRETMWRFGQRKNA